MKWRASKRDKNSLVDANDRPLDEKHLTESSAPSLYFPYGCLADDESLEKAARRSLRSWRPWAIAVLGQRRLPKSAAGLESAAEEAA